jgi:hypothetical protein
MDSSGELKSWHSESITAATEETLIVLRDSTLLGGAYLAGGTGLALQIGHRRSLDLDFFVRELFDEAVLLQRIHVLPGFALVAKSPHTLHATIHETKVSFLGYVYPLLFPAALFLGVQVADSRDIACMKVSAIASRGSKRDFVDLYEACRRFDLAELLNLFARKYAETRYNRVHILKSLVFFDDAEKDPLPHMLTSLDWDEVKRFFQRAVQGLM